jgi:hypothetical protein
MMDRNDWLLVVVCAIVGVQLAKLCIKVYQNYVDRKSNRKYDAERTLIADKNPTYIAFNPNGGDCKWERRWTVGDGLVLTTVKDRMAWLIHDEKLKALGLTPNELNKPSDDMEFVFGGNPGNGMELPYIPYPKRVEPIMTDALFEEFRVKASAQNKPFKLTNNVRTPHAIESDTVGFDMLQSLDMSCQV